MLRMTLESGEQIPVTNRADVIAALRNLKPHGDEEFAVLEREDQDYVQVVAHKLGYAVEVRRGSSKAHYSAARPTSSDLPQSVFRKSWQFWKRRLDQDDFTHAEVEEIFVAYLENAGTPSFMKWVKLEFPR